MMTRRQKQVYDFILSYVEQHQISPTMQEIADHLGIKNRSNVHAFLKKMEEHGLVKKSKTKLSRSIEIVTETKPCEHCIQLREALQEIAKSQPSECEQAFNFKMIARAALKEKK